MYVYANNLEKWYALPRNFHFIERFSLIYFFIGKPMNENTIVQLDFELRYFNDVIQYVNHDTT